MTANRKKQSASPKRNSRQTGASFKPNQGQGERILFVNDEESAREVVCAMLTTAGYQCGTAADGLEALAVFASGQEFELLLTNLMMPNLDGMGLLERVKEMFPDMPVVIESTISDFSVALQALRLGAYDYLWEPIEAEELFAVLRRALEYRRLRLENRDYQNRLGTLEIPRTHKPERILVQDDEESTGQVFCAMLTAAGYKCRAVAWPKEAWHVLTTGRKFDLLLCGLLESLGDKVPERMSKTFPDVPVVVASAYYDFSRFSMALRTGAYDYLRKPFVSEQLLAVVRRALEYRRLKLENRAYQMKIEKLATKNSSLRRARK